jgi:hypothetical protein
MQQEGERCIHSNFECLKRRVLLGMPGVQERKNTEIDIKEITCEGLVGLGYLRTGASGALL